ncbi:MAG TPA: hypothetical protein VFV90_04365, partial [Usitatibacter sp.]|nr:hypothetical protein [Usitatibacter sp.]
AMSPYGERATLIHEGACDAPLFEGVDTLLKRGIVELALVFQDCLQGAVLLPGGQEPIPKGKNHEGNIATSRLAR